MNRRQLVAMWCAVGVIVLMGLFPPLRVWSHRYAGGIGWSGYYFIGRTAWSETPGRLVMSPSDEDSSVDLSRLGVQVAMVALIGAAGIYSLRAKK